MGSTWEPRHSGTYAFGVCGSVPYPVPENGDGGGLPEGLAKAEGQRLNLNCPRSAVSGAASLAATAGALPNEWPQEPPSSLCPRHPGLASSIAGPRPCAQLPAGLFRKGDAGLGLARGRRL